MGSEHEKHEMHGTSEAQGSQAGERGPHYVIGAAVILAALLVSATLYVSLSSLSVSLGSLKLAAAAAPSAGAAAGVAAQPPQQAPPSAAPSPQPQAAAPSGKISLSDAASKGSDSAKIALVEYSDFQCPFCRSFYSGSLGQIEKDFVDSGRVKFVYKHFPLSFHPSAQPAAEAFECARDQGRQWEMHDRIFEEQNKLGTGTVQFSVQDIKNWAAQIAGLDAARFGSCLDSGQKSPLVSRMASEGAQAGIQGTPGFLITDASGKILSGISGAQPYSAFKQALEAAGA